MRFTKNLRTLMGCALLAAASTASAANLNFNVPDGSWFTPTNWTPGGPPTNLDNARIGTAATQSTAIARINTGATANANNVVLGLDAGTDGTLRINNGSILNVANNFTVGSAGTGTFFSLDTTTTNITGDMIVGNQSGAVGTANIRDDSTVGIGGFLRIGNQAGSTGTMDVSTQSAAILGAGVAAGSMAGNIVVGNAGTGDLTIHDGAVVGSFNAIIIGNQATGIGTVILRGENSTGTVPSVLATLGGNGTVGDAGQGTLELHNGAEFNLANIGNLRIARQAGSIGTVLVEGVGPVSGSPSEINVGGLFVGGDNGGVGGQGMLTIKNGGVVDATGNMIVWGIGSGARSELDVDSTYTLNVLGALNFNGGALHFIGDGTDFVNDATLNDIPGPDLNGMHVTVTDSNTATISGQLSGNGHLVKEGNGTLILTNLGNIFTGGLNINNGTVVAADTAGFAPVSVLGVGNVNLNGDINTRLRTPEGTPLFYVVVNDFNANTGQLYTQVGGTALGTDSDFLFVGGNANLSPNSHLFAHQINGYAPNNGDVVTILGSFTLVNGEFGDAPQGGLVPNDFVGLIQPFADYSLNASEVNLVFGFAASFASVAKTPNQIATATALDAAVAAGCIVPATNVLGNIPINLLRHAYDLIAPEELASIYEASFGQGMAQSLNLQHRMDDIRWGSTGFCADGFVIQDNHGYTKNDGKSVADKNPVEQVAPPNYRWGTFITGTGELTKVGQEDDNADGYQLNNASFTMGVDYRVTDHWAIGLSGGYTHTSGDLVNDGHLNTDGGRIGLYTTWGSGGFYVDASATGGWNQYDTRRTAYLGQDTGSTDGAEFDGMIAAGYDWKRGCWIFGPYADFEYSYVEFNSFSEDDRLFSNTSSLIPLHFPDQNQSAYRSNLGFRIAHEQVMKPGEGLTVVPEVRAAWRHDFGDNSYAIDSNFIGCTDVFTVHGPWIGSDSAVVDIGLTAYCTQQLSAYIFYQGQFGRDNYNNNAISGGMRWAF